MKLDLIDLIALLALIQLSFLTVVILNYKRGRRASNLLLAGFMASNALLLANSLLTRFGWISPDKWVLIYSIGSSAYFLLMPFLYLYIRSLCRKDPHLEGAYLLHGITFGIFVFFSLFMYLLNHDFLGDGTLISVRQQIRQAEFWSHKIVLHAQIFSYLVASVIVLSRYRKRLREFYSSIERIDLHWCNLILEAFATMWSLDLLNWIFEISHLSSPAASYWLFLASLSVNLAFTLVITYKGLAQSASISGIQALPKYASSRLKQSESDDIVRKLTACMESDKPHLSPSTSLIDLSEKLSIPVKNLSQVIHTHFKQNFYDFINAYRIEETKRRIHDERYRNLTLFAIGLDAGFNSKSVFNAAFKKHTGMRPKEYRRRHLP